MRDRAVVRFADIDRHRGWGRTDREWRGGAGGDDLTGQFDIDTSRVVDRDCRSKRYGDGQCEIVSLSNEFGLIDVDGFNGVDRDYGVVDDLTDGAGGGDIC